MPICNKETAPSERLMDIFVFVYLCNKAVHFSD